MSDERVRLFVALELPLQIRQTLVEWRAEAITAKPPLRLIDREALHVTLCFMGWQRSAELEAIGEACEVVSGSGSAPLSLAGSAWLPPRRPRVLAARLGDADGALGRVQAALAGALAAGGWYEPEARPFLAHVTVARVPRGARIRQLELPDPPPVSFSGSDVTLFRSRLQRSGASYEKLRTISLLSDPGS